MTTNVPGTGQGKRPGTSVSTGSVTEEFPPPLGAEQQPTGEGAEEQRHTEVPDTWGNTVLPNQPQKQDTWGNPKPPSQPQERETTWGNTELPPHMGQGQGA